jgi:hypothetical protein
MRMIRNGPRRVRVSDVILSLKRLLWRITPASIRRTLCIVCSRAALFIYPSNCLLAHFTLAASLVSGKRQVSTNVFRIPLRYHRLCTSKAYKSKSMYKSASTAFWRAMCGDVVILLGLDPKYRLDRTSDLPAFVAGRFSPCPARELEQGNDSSEHSF